MPRSATALIEAPLLEWARGTSGLSVEAAAKKAGVAPERLSSWEMGDSQPTVKQLRKLAHIYRRPIAVFYLPEIPATFQPLRDFRRLPGTVVPPSTDLVLQIRRAEERREFAIELLDELGEAVPHFEFSAQLDEEPEVLASRLRSFLGIEYDDQVAWSPGHQNFNRWRAAVERSRVMVFQILDVDLREARGFSLYADRLPAVAVNIKDSTAGRAFTILHELAHLAVRQPGLCDLHDGSGTDPEVYCNHVAGAALVPADTLVREEIVRQHRQDSLEWSNDELQRLANRYGTNREVILRRLLILGRTNSEFYQEKRDEYRRESEQRQSETREGFAPPHRMAVSAAGPAFVRLVLDNFHQENITASDVADFLDVKLKHLPRIESEILGAAR